MRVRPVNAPARSHTGSSQAGRSEKIFYIPNGPEFPLPRSPVSRAGVAFAAAYPAAGTDTQMPSMRPTNSGIVTANEISEERSIIILG